MGLIYLAGDVVRLHHYNMYHERQRKQLCLVHALNAIMQQEEFTEESLNEICYSLDERRWFNPHKSWLNLGNYDVNVLMAALATKDLQMMWFDSRQDPARIRLEFVKASNIFLFVLTDCSPFQLGIAFIVNVPGRYIPFMTNRHWFSILQRDDGAFVNLDSKLEEPELIRDIVAYIREKFEKTEDKVQVMIVSSMDSAELLKSE